MNVTNKDKVRNEVGQYKFGQLEGLELLYRRMNKDYDYDEFKGLSRVELRKKNRETRMEMKCLKT